MSGTTDFLYNTATDLSTLYTATTDGIAQINQQPAIKDTSSTDGQEAIPKGYVSPSNRPQLTTPGPNNPAGFDHVQMLINNFPEMVLGYINAIPAPTGEDKFADKMEAMLEAIGEEKLSLFGGGDPKVGLARVKYAVLHEGAQFPKEIKELAQQIREKASESAGYSANEFLVAVGDTATPVIYRLNFEDKVRTAGLTETELKQVFFASDFPEAAASLTPKLQKILKEAEASALEQVSTELGLPSDYQIPRNTAVMKKMLGEELGKSVDDQLYGLLNSKAISRAEYNEMRTLLAMPGANTPHAEKLMPILQKLIEAAIGELKKDYGIPDGFPLSADGSDFQALLNGTYFAEFNKQLGNPSLNLTANQQAQLKEALISEKAADALSPELKTIFENLKATTLAKVSVTYGLPDTWQPDTNALSEAATRTQNPGFKFAQEGFNQCMEALNSGKKILKEMDVQSAIKETKVPSAPGGDGGPFRILLKDYLKALSMILITMQEILAKQSVSDSTITSTMGIMQRDEKLGELQKRQKELDKIIAKQKKAATMGPLKALFEWVLAHILILFLGPAGVAIVVYGIMKNAERGGSFNVCKMDMIGDLAKAFIEIGKSLGGPGGKMFADFAKAITMVAICVLCPDALMFDLMFGEAAFLKEILTGLQVPKKQAGYVAMAIQLTAMIVAMVVLCVFTGGASIMAGALKIAESCGQLALRILQTVEKIVSFIQKYLNEVFAAIKNALGITPNVASNAAAKAPGLLQKAIDAVENFIAKAQNHIANIVPEKMEAANRLGQVAKAAEEASQAAAENFEKLGQVPGVSQRELNHAMQTAQAAENNAKVAKEAYDAAMIPINAAENFAGLIVLYVQNTFEITLTTVQTGADIFKKSIEIQIIRIKADLESNRIIVEEFIKLIKKLIDKLMETITGMGEDIKETVNAHKKLFEGLSQVIAQLFQA